MLGFLSEIKKEFKLPDFVGEYNIVNINGKALYIEGHKGLVSISDEAVRVKVKDKIITISGKDLKLKIMSTVTLGISGEIESISIN